MLNIESESSGRSVSPSSTLASGSEVEIEDLSTIEPTASFSAANKKTEYKISHQGTGSSPTSVAIPKKYNYSPSTSSILPGISQQHMQDTRTNQIDRTDNRSKDLWRFGCKRKSSAPFYESEGAGEEITIPPPKYTPPASTSKEVALGSSFSVDSRSPKSLKRSQSTTKQHNSKSKIDAQNIVSDTEDDRPIHITVPKGKN